MNNTTELINHLLFRKEELEFHISQTKSLLLDKPSGSLRISQKKSHPQYYQKLSNKLIYIPQSNISFAKNLAQKSYNEKILNAMSLELSNINSLLSSYENKNVDNIYNRYTNERQKLITPISKSNVAYGQEWESEPYIPKEFNINDKSTHYTNRRERVRSKSEIIIANMLLAANVPYKYECPLEVKYNPNISFIHPDFTVLNTRTRQIYYWEHLGKMDDEEYIQTTFSRIKLYERNGIILGDKLILTYESLNSPLDTRTVEKIINNLLK